MAAWPLSIPAVLAELRILLQHLMQLDGRLGGRYDAVRIVEEDGVEQQWLG
jgi:hypothetical protein